MLDQCGSTSLFQLQMELVDGKVEMAVSRSIDKVIEQIHLSRAETTREFAKVREELNLSRAETSKEIEKVREELNLSRAETSKEIEKVRDELKEMRSDLQRIDKRVITIETKLGIVNERQRELRNRFFDYAFKTGWLVLGTVVTFAILHAQLIAKL